MARAIWTGAISFGLVMVPVGLFSATEDRSPRFNQFQRGTSDRIRYQRVNERTGEKVEYDDIVSGREVAPGSYVLIESSELDAIAPGKSRTIDISGFVDLNQIDVAYFAKTYYLAPQKDNERTYALLLQTLQRTNKAGIATFVMRGQEHLAALRPREDVLALHTMHFADEVRDPAAVVDTAVTKTSFDKRELAMAEMLVDSLSVDFDPSAYHDTYRQRVEELVEAKRSGAEVVAEAEPSTPTNVVDLMEALRRSVEQSRGGKPAKEAPAEDRQDDQDELATMTKTELARHASTLGIAGRSSMNRDQLEKAVRDAGGPPRTRRAS